MCFDLGVKFGVGCVSIDLCFDLGAKFRPSSNYTRIRAGPQPPVKTTACLCTRTGGRTRTSSPSIRVGCVLIGFVLRPGANFREGCVSIGFCALTGGQNVREYLSITHGHASATTTTTTATTEPETDTTTAGNGKRRRPQAQGAESWSKGTLRNESEND